MLDIHIEPKTEGKGRTFSAAFLASIEADLMWPGGQTASDNQRPVWSMFAGTEQELRAFMANLSTGRLAVFTQSRSYRRSRTNCLEILKSAGYQVTWQREAEGAVATIFLPDLFRIDPGMVDPNGAMFLMLPTKEWHGKQTLDTEKLVRYAQYCGHGQELSPEVLAGLVPNSYLFAAYLDRRTRCPLIADGRFYFQIMLACLKEGLASFSTENEYGWQAKFGHHPSMRFKENDTQDVGFMPGIAFRASHERIEELLAQEVDIYFSLRGSL